MWYRPNETSKSRIDRVFVSDLWLVHWPGSTQYINSILVSDHCGVVVCNSVLDWGPKPFRTFDIWEKVDVKDVIRSSWEQSVNRGSSLEMVKDKFKRLKVDLRRWRDEVSKKEVTMKKDLIEQISQLDLCDDLDMLDEEMRLRRVRVLGEFSNLADREVAMSRQKAKVEWSKNGDTNSKFFHSRLR